MSRKIVSLVKRLFPVVGVLLAYLVQISIPDNSLHPSSKHHYYEGLLFILLGLALLFFLLSFFIKKVNASLEEKGPFLLGASGLVIVINLVTAKFALLPVIFFPTYNNILAVFVEQLHFFLSVSGIPSVFCCSASSGESWPALSPASFLAFQKRFTIGLILTSN